MNVEQANNLRILITHMETKVTRMLDMSVVTNECGTPACAFGEAACMSHFHALGLHAHKRAAMCGVVWKGQPSSLGDCADEIFGTEAGRCYDGSDSTRARLFGASLRNAWGRNDVTPQEWAAEARKVLAENGYDDKPAEFIERVKSWGPLADLQPNWDNA